MEKDKCEHKYEWVGVVGLFNGKEIHLWRCAKCKKEFEEMDNNLINLSES